MKAEFLPQIIRGEIEFAIGYSEPNAGSDLANVGLKAELDGDQWVLDGTKTFITAGDHDLTKNIIHLVLARLPDAPKGIKGISMFYTPPSQLCPR